MFFALTFAFAAVLLLVTMFGAHSFLKFCDGSLNLHSYGSSYGAGRTITLLFHLDHRRCDGISCLPPYTTSSITGALWNNRMGSGNEATLHFCESYRRRRFGSIWRLPCTWGQWQSENRRRISPSRLLTTYCLFMHRVRISHLRILSFGICLSRHLLQLETVSSIFPLSTLASRILHHSLFIPMLSILMIIRLIRL